MLVSQGVAPPISIHIHVDANSAKTEELILPTNAKLLVLSLDNPIDAQTRCERMMVRFTLSDKSGPLSQSGNVILAFGNYVIQGLTPQFVWQGSLQTFRDFGSVVKCTVLNQSATDYIFNFRAIYEEMLLT